MTPEDVLKLQNALQLIEIGLGIAGVVFPAAATAEEIVKFGELITKQIQTYQAMSGVPIEDVLIQLTPVDTDPNVLPKP